ncbi:DUF1129 family protein [Bacillus sp. CRN 9]|nr:DUF1129 family protein [Bacillus sp. CRN 9]
MSRELSKESMVFLHQLKLYLMSDGKNEHEIEEIIEELSDHLQMAESQGKSVHHIIGQSPKEYMAQIAAEMNYDKKAWIKFIVTIIFGVFSYTILTRSVEGNLSFSLINAAGLTAIVAFLIWAVFFMFKYIAANNPSKAKEYLLFFLFSLVSFTLFIALILIDQRVESPTFSFNGPGTIIISIITFAFLVWISIWSKTWTVLIFLSFLIVPDIVLKQTSMDINTQISLSTTITLGGIAIYLFVVNKKNKAT